MGSVHALSPYEQDHIQGMIFVDEYRQQHDGALPDIPWIDFLHHRFDLNEARFTHYHPNMAEWFTPCPPLDDPCPPVIPCPPVVPCPPDPPVCIGCDPCPPDPGCHVVPEPPGAFSLAIALCLGLAMRRRWFA